MDNIKLVYSNSKSFNGIKLYSLHLYEDLINSGLSVKLKPLHKIEFTINKKKVGGWLSQRLFTFLIGNAKIVHSTSHWDISKYTNITTIHDLIPLLEKDFNISTMARNYYMHILNTVKKQVKVIIVPSNYVKSQVESVIKDIHIEVIPSKIFVKDAIKNPYPVDNKLHLLTIGEIRNGFNRKQIFELYDWLKDNEYIDLYHIGKIEDTRYINYAKNIHWLGSVSEQDKFNYLKYADKFVFKTIGEGQGFPVMEAMKMNTQVVINDIPVHRELLGDKPYYFNSKDEFFYMIYANKKSGLVNQIFQYDNWIEKYLKVYGEFL